MPKSFSDPKNKRPPVYNDRLSVLDFRPKKRKLMKPSRLNLQFHPPTPSETIGSSSASPVEQPPLLPWDEAEFTTDVVARCANLLLNAVAEAMPDFADLQSDSEDEFETEDVSFGADSEAIEVLPLLVESERPKSQNEDEVVVAPAIDEDEMEDDEWDPSRRLKQVWFSCALALVPITDLLAGEDQRGEEITRATEERRCRRSKDV
jgi:hypothetical protein